VGPGEWLGHQPSTIGLLQTPMLALAGAADGSAAVLQTARPCWRRRLRLLQTAPLQDHCGPTVPAVWGNGGGSCASCRVHLTSGILRDSCSQAGTAVCGAVLGSLGQGSWDRDPRQGSWDSPRVGLSWDPRQGSWDSPRVGLSWDPRQGSQGSSLLGSSLSASQTAVRAGMQAGPAQWRPVSECGVSHRRSAYRLVLPRIVLVPRRASGRVWRVAPRIVLVPRRGCRRSASACISAGHTRHTNPPQGAGAARPPLPELIENNGKERTCRRSGTASRLFV
jgi:hypothetical protein